MFPDLLPFMGYSNSYAFILKTYSDSILLHIQIKPGSFSNDDSASNENVKKAKMSKRKPQILQVHHAFLVHFFAVSARQRHEISLCNVVWRT